MKSSLRNDGLSDEEFDKQIEDYKKELEKHKKMLEMDKNPFNRVTNPAGFNEWIKFHKELDEAKRPLIIRLFHKIDRQRYYIYFLVLLAFGAYLLDKGQNGNNIAVTQFFGAVLVFFAGVFVALSNADDR